jgi:NAD(P)-dependent dehydrogenase (short-subunit alcohol dehydrogenase family)
VAVVTGADRGLGREISLTLAGAGAAVAVADLAEPVETAGRVGELGASALALACDVTKEDQVRNLAGEVAERLGRVDILVNNAGITQLDYRPTQELDLAVWERVLAVNLTGAFLMCKHLGRSMVDQGGGRIVNIASTAGFTGVTRAPAYCASKAGLILLTKSLALEWARYGVLVNAVAPHYLETALTAGLTRSPDVHQGLTRQIPLRRFGRPEEVAGAVLLLASTAGSYMTGSVITVDGGYLAQ